MARRRRRRRQPKQKQKPRGGPAPHDGSLLGHLSDAELVRQFAEELARHRAGKGALDLGAIESFAEDAQRKLGEETLGAVIAALPPEGSTPSLLRSLSSASRAKGGFSQIAFL